MLSARTQTGVMTSRLRAPAASSSSISRLAASGAWGFHRAGHTSGALRRPHQHQRLRPLLAPAAETSQRRTLVNAFMRPPFRTAIPSVAPDGTPVDRDRFIIEYNGLIEAIKNCMVFDELNIMDALPGFESIRTGDLVFGVSDLYMPMPRHGMEHRQSELAETMRYLRAAGASGTTLDLFQQDEKARVCTGDLLNLPGLVVIARTIRTNAEACAVIQTAHAYKPDHKAWLSLAVDFGEDKDSPPLANVAGFGGQNIIIISDCPFGNKVAKMLAEQGTTRPWYFARVEPGVQWISVYGGGAPNYDMIMTDESEVSLQSVAKAGMNPIPVSWNEPRKLGLSLRDVVLSMVFMKMGAGNVTQVNPFNRSKQRVFATEKRSDGDRGAPLYAQMRNYELPPIVFQEPPRYKPPMHRREGQITPHVPTGPGGLGSDKRSHAEKRAEADDAASRVGRKGVLPGQGAPNLMGGRQ